MTYVKNVWENDATRGAHGIRQVDDALWATCTGCGGELEDIVHSGVKYECAVCGARGELPHSSVFDCEVSTRWNPLRIEDIVGSAWIRRRLNAWASAWIGEDVEVRIDE